MTRQGVVLRMLREVVFFESLFKSNKWIWLFGWLFHFGLFLVLLRHLRYFTQPVWTWVALIQPFGMYAALPWSPAWPACGRAASWSTGYATSPPRPIT